jgi:uncharacterized protein with FMN-binding domain
MAKMDKKWVILCSAAIAAVYSTGYFSTETQANKVAVPQTAQVTIHKNVNPINNTNAKVSQPIRVYKDGTFTGTGWNRRGQIEVAVTLKNDKITDVQISNWGMHYSERDVVGLPNEVIQKQNAQVNNVSGATYSTQAFSDAVQDALNQAHHA